MNLRESQQQLENLLAQTIDSAEGMHRMAATGIFEQLGQIAPLSGLVQGIRPGYENGAAQVFEMGRTLNRSAGELARAILDRVGM
ncbi:MAG: hypothetical protein OHK0011_11030 [Turneriella sp.]